MRVATPLTGWRLVATRAASPARVSPAASFERARSRAGADPGAGWRFEVREISLRRFYLRWHKRHFRARCASEGFWFAGAEIPRSRFGLGSNWEVTHRCAAGRLRHVPRRGQRTPALGAHAGNVAARGVA